MVCCFMAAHLCHCWIDDTVKERKEQENEKEQDLRITETGERRTEEEHGEREAQHVVVPVKRID